MPHSCPLSLPSFGGKSMTWIVLWAINKIVVLLQGLVLVCLVHHDRHKYKKVQVLCPSGHSTCTFVYAWMLVHAHVCPVRHVQNLALDSKNHIKLFLQVMELVLGRVNLLRLWHDLETQNCFFHFLPFLIGLGEVAEGQRIWYSGCLLRTNLSNWRRIGANLQKC